MVDAGLISDRYRVNLVLPKEGEMNRQNTGISGDEEIFNIVNHALFAYYAGQNPLSGFGAQAKEHFQGMQQKMRGKDPRTEYLDYANNEFGIELARQGLSPQEAKNASTCKRFMFFFFSTCSYRSKLKFRWNITTKSWCMLCVQVPN